MNYCLILGGVLLLINLLIFSKESIRKDKSIITYFFLGFSTLLSIALIASILQTILLKYVSYLHLENIIMSCIYLIPSLILIMTLLFVNNNIKSYLVIASIFLIPAISIALLITNPITHLLYENYNHYFSELQATPVYYATLLLSGLNLVLSFIIILIGNLKRNSVLLSKSIVLFFETILCFVFLAFSYLSIIPNTNLTIVNILTMHSLIFYFLIIRYRYINAVPIGLENSINFLNSSVIVIDVKGNIVYTNIHTKSFFKNVLGIYLKITNLFELLDAFDKELCKNIKYGLKNLYKVNGLSIETDSLYGLAGKLYIKLQMYEIKGTEYYLIMLSDTKQQHKELLEIEAKQNVINMQSQLATVGELALGVVHDIKTPISALNTAIEILKSTALTASEKEIIDTIDISAKKITVISSSIKDQFKNADSTEKQTFNLTEFIDTIVFNMQSKLNDSHCTINLNLDNSINVTGNKSKLSQIFMNIIFNSIKAYTEKNTSGPIFIKTYTKNNNICIDIKDNAGGIPENLRPHIFNNILTTKGTKGFGLGLYISNSIIQGEFNGNITFECKNNSTIIYLKIPLQKNMKGDS